MLFFLIFLTMSFERRSTFNPQIFILLFIDKFIKSSILYSLKLCNKKLLLDLGYSFEISKIDVISNDEKKISIWR